MKIFIYNGNHKSTVFIQILVNSINNNNYKTVIIGFDDALINYNKNGIEYISIGSNRSIFRLILRTFILYFQQIWHYSFRRVYEIITIAEYTNPKEILSSMNIRTLISIFQPDIIHIQWSSHLSLFRQLLNTPTNQRPKIIVSLRGRLVNISPLTNPSIAELYRDFFPKVDGFHAVSEAIAKEAQRWGAETHKIKVIYSGLELHKIINYHKNDWEINSPLSILLVGRFHWIKGYYYALDALRLLLDKEFDIHFTIIAGQPSEEILYQINSLKLSEYINILPNLSHDEVLNYMQNADMLLLPSVMEGIANVVLEAMAVGLPVVSSDCGGMSEVIDNEINGLLFQNRNVADMAVQLEKMINYTPEERERLAIAARQRVSAQFGADRLGKEMIAFYEEVCKKN